MEAGTILEEKYSSEFWLLFDAFLCESDRFSKFNRHKRQKQQQSGK